MSFFVYILQCSDTSYYTGHTDNLEKRLAEHTQGTLPSCYTFNRRPLQLVFQQPFVTREEALAAEQQIKGWSRAKKEAMMRGDWQEVSMLARNRANSVRPERVEGQTEIMPPNRPEIPVRPEPVEGRIGSALRQAQSERWYRPMNKPGESGA
ncbi:MAG: GIY-YIG nuclease family protein [Candidatus Geothermincolia bacterium]